MRRASKGFILTVLLIAAFSGLSLIVSEPKTSAQSGTNVVGLTSQNTSWTVSGSPYTLTGNVLVYQGTTLTIEPDVTVNLGTYYLEVNGTLSAVGNLAEKVTFNGGELTFTASANSWNEQTNSGCLIENAIIQQTSISSVNPIKIDSCVIDSQITVASSIITNNVVTGDIHSYTAFPELGQTNSPVDTSVISGNSVNGNIIIGSLGLGSVTAPSEACTVSGNSVEGSIWSGSPPGLASNIQ